MNLRLRQCFRGMWACFPEQKLIPRSSEVCFEVFSISVNYFTKISLHYNARFLKVCLRDNTVVLLYLAITYFYIRMWAHHHDALSFNAYLESSY